MGQPGPVEDRAWNGSRQHSNSNAPPGPNQVDGAEWSGVSNYCVGTDQAGFAGRPGGIRFSALPLTYA